MKKTNFFRFKKNLDSKLKNKIQQQSLIFFILELTLFLSWLTVLVDMFSGNHILAFLRLIFDYEDRYFIWPIIFWGSIVVSGFIPSLIVLITHLTISICIFKKIKKMPKFDFLKNSDLDYILFFFLWNKRKNTDKSEKLNQKNYVHSLN